MQKFGEVRTCPQVYEVSEHILYSV